MALSLVCQDCKAQLRSVAEMQAHTEATSHVSFAESTEPVLNLQCSDCGKPCRSETERELHTKRTGHADFEDKTADTPMLETETEMIEARQHIEEEANKAGSDSAETILEPPSIDTEMRQGLEDMGFSANRATRALHFTQSSSMEQAINWLEEHSNDADMDEPLLVPKEAQRPKLAPEEARKQAEEMIRKTKAKKEKEERELERLREQERVRAGRELQAAQRLEADLRLKRNIEERRREKEEAARAKEKIRLRLAEDRAERRRKLGLPPQLTPEEEAAERAKAAASEAAKRRPLAPPRQPAQLDALRGALVQAKQEAAGDDEMWKRACQTLLKYVGNIAQNPSEEKFRKIKLANAAFQSRVAALPATLDFLAQLGFDRDTTGEWLVLPSDKAKPENLTAAGAMLDNAMTNPMFGAL